MGSLEFISVFQGVTYAVLVCCIILLFLISILFKRLSKLRKDLGLKESTLHEINDQLKFKQNMQEKIFSIIGNIENFSNKIEKLFYDFCKLFKVDSAFLFFIDDINGEESKYEFNQHEIDVDKFKVWLKEDYKKLVKPDKNTYSFTLIEQDENIPFMKKKDNTEEIFCVTSSFDIGERFVGGIVFSGQEKLMEKAREDIGQAFEIFRSIIAYRMIQSEIAYRTNEANIISVFLTEISVFTEIEKLIDALFEFFRDTYVDANVSLVIGKDTDTLFVKKGKLLEKSTVLKLVPEMKMRLKTGTRFIYAPDVETMIKKYKVGESPIELKSVLIVPLVTFNEIFGYLVFEYLKQNPLKMNTLNTIIRLSEISSFVLRKTIFFKDKLDDQEKRISELEKLLKHQAEYLKEKELMIKKLSDFNKVFKIAQDIKKSLITLKGFLTLIEKNQSKVNNEDDVLFRNCNVEIEKMENYLSSFQLSRVLTDRNLVLKKKKIDAKTFFNNLFKEIKARALLKKIELDLKYDDRISKIYVDVDYTFPSISQFFGKLLDMISSGTMLLFTVIKDGYIQLMLKYIPSTIEESKKLTAKIQDELQNDFTYSIVKKVLECQEGKIDLEFFVEKGFLLRVLFPPLKENQK